MPNWTSNSLSCKGLMNIIKEKGYSSENTIFSFDKVKPMPKELDVVSGSSNREAMYYYRRTNMERIERDSELEERIANYSVDARESLYNEGKILCSNIDKYGYPTWYQWCWENWGVKWDACDVYEVDDDTIEFETPWGPPTPIYKEISKQNPGIEFDIVFIQEEGGKGEETYLDGECIASIWDDKYSLWDDDEEEEE